jgi:hypothetical protein
MIIHSYSNRKCLVKVADLPAHVCADSYPADGRCAAYATDNRQPSSRNVKTPPESCLVVETRLEI